MFINQMLLKLTGKFRIMLFVAIFASLGTFALVATHAQSPGSISGNVFEDTNRNGIRDSSEPPMVGKNMYVFSLDDNGNMTFVKAFSTDSLGAYTFNELADGKYEVMMASQTWWTMWDDWVPTTTGSLQPEVIVNLASQAKLDMGFRKIVRSTTTPIASKKFPNGLLVNVYNDAVQPDEVNDRLVKGTLFGPEAANMTIRLDYNNITRSSSTGSGTAIDGVNVSWYGAINLAWSNWRSTPDNTLFHEYGHVWSTYYAFMVQQELQNPPEFKGYLKARGLDQSPLLRTSYAWDPQEMIAEDYRQLFGTPEAAQGSHLNQDIPRPAEVPGLKEYLSGAFMKSPVDTVTPSVPTSLTGTGTLTTEGYGAKLSWTASTDNIGVSKYEIFRNGVLAGYVNNPTTVFFDGNLSATTSYQYYVKAVDAAGNKSPASTTITVKTPAPDTTKPSAPANLVSLSQSTTSISLKWNASTDNVAVKDYRVYKVGGNRKVGSTSTLLTATASTNFTVPNLSPATSNSYFVTAVDTAGNESLASNTITVKTARR